MTRAMIERELYMPFTSLGLGPKITRAIQESGYTEPTPIQSGAIPLILEGHDTIGIAQTGTGKTAAFVLPILERLAATPAARGRRAIRALVVSPTRELVVQIDENIRNYGKHLDLRYTTIYGGVGEGPQLEALRRGIDLVVATPGRLIDLMGRGGVDFKSLDVLVLDEADRMLDMGFLPQIRRVVSAIPKKRQTLLFSATLSKEIEAISQEFLDRPKKVQIGRSTNPAETVAQFVYEVSREGKTDLLIHLLRDEKLDMVLVFSRTKHGADKIARKLIASGITTATLHSNKSQSQRLRSLKGFRSGEYRVLVATDIAARGIDVDGISHVINFDFPPQPEDYVHRIGRTGRALAIGDALSFVTPDDQKNLRALERFIGRGIPRRVTSEKVQSSPASRPATTPRRDTSFGSSTRAGSRPARGRTQGSAASAGTRAGSPSARRSEESGSHRPDSAGSRRPAAADQASRGRRSRTSRRGQTGR
jgi:ATP-dependent RNA helicase RhlE